MGRHSRPSEPEPILPPSADDAAASPAAPEPTGRPISADDAAASPAAPEPSGRPSLKERANPALWTIPQRFLAALLLLGFIATVISAVMLWPSSAPARVDPTFQSSSSLPQDVADGTVSIVTDAKCGSPSVGRVFDDAPLEPNSGTSVCTRAIVDITSGHDKGKRTLLEISHQPGDPDLKVGDKIRMNRHSAAGGGIAYAFNDYQRTNQIIIWLIITAIAMVAIGAWRGARSLVGLVITMAVITIFMLPALLRGGSPILLAVTACALIMFIVIYLVHGVSWKASSALAGTVLSLGLAALLANWGINGTNLRGLGEEDNLLVQLYLPDVTVHGLMLAGFIVGAIGALNDATVAQASTVNELAAIEPDASAWRLFRGGMRVGRDHIASMLYTLILSYTGAALPMLMLLTAADRPLGQTLTSDLIGTEIVRSAVGAIALALAVPITTMIAAWTVNPHSEGAAGGHGHGHLHAHGHF